MLLETEHREINVMSNHMFTDKNTSLFKNAFIVTQKIHFKLSINRLSTFE